VIVWEGTAVSVKAGGVAVGAPVLVL
jgi:hypothetical protein